MRVADVECRRLFLVLFVLAADFREVVGVSTKVKHYAV